MTEERVNRLEADLTEITNFSEMVANRLDKRAADIEARQAILESMLVDTRDRVVAYTEGRESVLAAAIQEVRALAQEMAALTSDFGMKARLDAIRRRLAALGRPE